MTFREARFRVAVYFLVDWALRIISVSILITALAKGFYSSLVDTSCFILTGLCNFFQSLIVLVVNNCPFFGLLWMWLPDVPPGYWFLALVSGAGLCALFFFFFSFYLGSKRRKLRTALVEAEHSTRADSLVPRQSPQFFRNEQSVRDVQAGRDVRIEQTINNYPPLHDWDKRVSNSPLGQILIAAVGGVLAILTGEVLSILLRKLITG